MKNKALLRWILIIIFLATISLIPPVFGQETIKIGVAGSHTGDLASYGLPTVRAAEIIIKKVNDQGGIAGRKLQLLIQDEACRPELATNAATKLVSAKAHAVIGHICSGATKAALQTYKDANIIVISPSATSPELTLSGQYPNFHRTIAPDDTQAKLVVNFALQKLKLKNFAVIHDKGDYGKGFAEYAKKFLEESRGAKVVLFEGITPGAVDYSAIVQKIKYTRADAVIFGGYHPEAASVVQLMRKRGIKTVFISDDGVKDQTFIKVAAAAAEGVYASGPKDTTKNPLAIAAIAEHRKAYGAEPGAFYLNAYSAMLAVINTLAKTKSTEYKAMRHALRTYETDTPLGKIKFNNSGDAIGVGFSIYQVRAGAYVELK